MSAAGGSDRPQHGLSGAAAYNRFRLQPEDAAGHLCSATLLNPGSVCGCSGAGRMSAAGGSDRPQHGSSGAAAIDAHKPPFERAAVRGWKACEPPFVHGWAQADQVLQRLATEHCAGLSWKLGNSKTRDASVTYEPGHSTDVILAICKNAPSSSAWSFREDRMANVVILCM